MSPDGGVRLRAGEGCWKRENGNGEMGEKSGLFVGRVLGSSAGFRGRAISQIEEGTDFDEQAGRQ